MAESLIVVYNLLPSIAKQLHDQSVMAVKKTADIVVSVASVDAPEQTGFMKSALYTVTKSGSTYGQGVVPGEPDSYLLPEVDPPSNDQTAIVAAGANYSAYVEMGTSRMAAEPFLTPASYVGQKFLLDLMESFESMIKGVP